VPQPTTLPRVPKIIKGILIFRIFFGELDNILRIPKYRINSLLLYRLCDIMAKASSASALRTVDGCIDNRGTGVVNYYY
jgi:hypothetical protein